MKKSILMTPGPSQVPPETLLTLAKPPIHHRTPQFQAIMGEARANLAKVIGTTGDIVLLAGSGTSAMEAAAVGVLAAGGKALCIQGGKFGERWGDICKAFGFDYVTLDVQYGSPVDPAQVKQALDADKDLGVVFATLCETSTASRYPPMTS